MVPFGSEKKHSSAASVLFALQQAGHLSAFLQLNASFHSCVAIVNGGWYKQSAHFRCEMKLLVIEVGKLEKLAAEVVVEHVDTEAFLCFHERSVICSYCEKESVR